MVKLSFPWSWAYAGVYCRLVMRLDWELILNFRVGSRGVFMLSMLERRGRPRMVVRFGNVPNMVSQLFVGDI